MIRTWPGGVVPYVLDERLPARTRDRVRRSIEDRWNAAGLPVRLRPATADDADVVVVEPGRVDSSARGMLGGRQRITVSRDASCGVILHEIAHTAGLEHEHNRPDRDEHVEVVWANVDPAALSQFQRRDDAPSSPYDLASIMHYAPMAWSRNRRPTLRVRPAAAQALAGRDVLVGQRRDLSEGDRRRLDALYRPVGTAAR